MRAVRAAFLTLLVAAVCLPAPSRARGRGEETYRVRVEPAAALDASWDVAGRDRAGGDVELIVDEAGLARLLAAGHHVEVLEQRTGGVPRSDAAERVPTDPLPETDYMDPEELELYLQQTIADHPAITRLEPIGVSVAGRPIWAVLVSDNAAVDEDEPAILFNAATHGREVMTPEVIVDTIDWLTDQYGVDPAMTARVDAYAIWLVPMVNPDGVDLVFNIDRWWRKNASDYDGNGRITWKDGIDVNRNYEWGWGNQCLGSSEINSEATYRGSYEASEPETRAMIDLGRRIRPVFYVEYHSWGEDVFYALGCDPSMAPRLATITEANQQVERVIAEQYAAQIVQADGQIGFTASPYGNRVDGIGRDQHAHDSGAIALVTELNGVNEGFQPPFAAWRDATVEGQRPGWLWLIDRIGGPAIGGHVVDAETGQPVTADLALDELTILDDRRLTNDPATGRFHLIVVPGAYTLRVSSAGYADATVPVTVGSTWEPIVVELARDATVSLLADDLEDPAADTAWTAGDASDDASAGLWERGDPFGTHSGDLVALDLVRGTPATDRTPGLGTHAFVTGNAAGVGFSDDDVDGGVTTLESPAFDTSGHYGVVVSWQQWLQKDAADPADGLFVEFSPDDGASWIPVLSQTDPTTGASGEQVWQRASFQADAVAAPGPSRVRFRVVDAGDDHVVEAAIDELEVRAYPFAAGEVALQWPDEASFGWESIPGGAGAEYEIVRGDVAQLAFDAGEVELGPLACVGVSPATGWSLAHDDDPVPGEFRFYLVRFRLPYTSGSWGAAADGTPRGFEAVCP